MLSSKENRKLEREYETCVGKPCRDREARMKKGCILKKLKAPKGKSFKAIYKIREIK